MKERTSITYLKVNRIAPRVYPRVIDAIAFGRPCWTTGELLGAELFGPRLKGDLSRRFYGELEKAWIPAGGNEFWQKHGVTHARAELTRQLRAIYRLSDRRLLPELRDIVYGYFLARWRHVEDYLADSAACHDEYQ